MKNYTKVILLLLIGYILKDISIGDRIYRFLNTERRPGLLKGC